MAIETVKIDKAIVQGLIDKVLLNSKSEYTDEEKEQFYINKAWGILSSVHDLNSDMIVQFIQDDLEYRYDIDRSKV